MLEKELFPPLKKYFKEQGYKVYAEVPSGARGIDFVAVREDRQVAVEMKTSFNTDVIYQANTNAYRFAYSYVAYPVRIPVLFESPLTKLSESVITRLEACRRRGIGILQVLPHGTVFEALAAADQNIKNINKIRPYDFSQYVESDTDEAGLPCQKGVSEGYYELKLIKEYVRQHPKATWKEIYLNVQNHYSSPASLSGSMSSWRGFRLAEYKKELLTNPISYVSENSSDLRGSESPSPEDGQVSVRETPDQERVLHSDN